MSDQLKLPKRDGRAYGELRLISIADVPSIACACPANLRPECEREGRCQDERVSIFDGALIPDMSVFDQGGSSA